MTTTPNSSMMPTIRGFTCGGGSLEEIYIHGCWDHRGPMKVLRDNSTALTLAHELLHIIYYDYYRAYNNDEIDEWIDAVVASNPQQTAIILKAYNEQIAGLPAEQARYIEYTELYAFIGTQFTHIPSAFEAHYALYFEDRQAVVNIFLDWVVGTREKIREREKYSQQLIDQAAEYIKCLNDVNRVTGDCSEYQPDRDQYADYDNCLVSRKTFLDDCRHLQPTPFMAYELAPLIANPPIEDNQEVQELIEEAEELVSQVNAEQEEAEESFIRELVFYEHNLDGENYDSGDNTDEAPATVGAEEADTAPEIDEGDSDDIAPEDGTDEDGDSESQTTDADPNQLKKKTQNADRLLLGLSISGTLVFIAVTLTTLKIYRQRKGVTEEDLTPKNNGEDK